MYQESDLLHGDPAVKTVPDLREDVPVSNTKKNPKTSSQTTPDLFEQDWLTEHLRQVVSELRGLPADQQPRLTGARAATMSNPTWLSDEMR
jgi:hypothetical protein